MRAARGIAHPRPSAVAAVLVSKVSFEHEELLPTGKIDRPDRNPRGDPRQVNALWKRGLGI
jgi:hypothetical protein